MKKIIVFIIAVMYSGVLISQNTDILRQKALKFKEKGEIDSSIYYFSKILDVVPGDYQARLTLGKLYFDNGNYLEAEKHFKNLYKEHKKDEEVIKGLADAKLYNDNIKGAIKYYLMALEINPTSVPVHFGLAKAYSWNGQLDKAIGEYNAVMRIDSTYSEAWQGIGKMYYWMEKPRKALHYYKKAVELDPANEEILKEYREIKDELKWQLATKYIILNEEEEFYNIDARIKKVSLAKRLSDHFEFSVFYALDNSDRDYKDSIRTDTSATYDNGGITMSWINRNSKLTAFVAYSSSDEKLSNYGLKWRWTHDASSVRIENTVQAAYDYFYYWNKIGQKFVSDKIKLKSGKIILNLEASYGIIDSTYIEDVPADRYFVDFNPHYDYGISMSYKLLSKPEVRLGAGFSYTNYKYKSKYYYSPLGRKLFGPSLTLYYPAGNFYFYSGFTVNAGSEFYYEIEDGKAVKHYIDASNWSADAECGYRFHFLEISLSASRFYNEYYANYNIAFGLKYML